MSDAAAAAEPLSVVQDNRLHRSALWRKLVYTMTLLGALGPLLFGVFEGIASTREAAKQAAQSQKTLARDISFVVSGALASAQKNIQAVTSLPWQLDDQFTRDVRRVEYGRLLKLVPAIESLSFIDKQGDPRLVVSRRGLDSINTQTNSRVLSGTSERGQVLYRDAYEPVLIYQVAYEEPQVDGKTIAHINLRTLALELSQPLTVTSATVYVVDSHGVVVLHRDPNQMIARKQISSALAATDESAKAAEGLNGVSVMRSTVAVAGTDWRVVVEQPREAILQPVKATAVRAALFTALAVAVSALVAVVMAAKIVRPVRRLHGAAMLLGAGSMQARVSLQTNDELEDLAHQFNRMAASLQANLAELEDKVAARTADLQRANQHKNEFLANMSHELRTPLNAILGFADVLREGMAGPMNEEQREYMADIHASGLHLLSLINDLLDLSRIESGLLQLELADFDVAETVESAVALVRQRCAQKGVQLLVHVDSGLAHWRADPRRVKQMLVNLLTNAVKFTPAEGRIGLRAWSALHALTGQNCLCLDVQDSGVGMAAADHERVFEVSVQVGDDATGRAEGAGLGLALVRRFARAHGGDVTLSSALGVGTTFHLVLP